MAGLAFSGTRGQTNGVETAQLVPRGGERLLVTLLLVIGVSILLLQVALSLRRLQAQEAKELQANSRLPARWPPSLTVTCRMCFARS